MDPKIVAIGGGHGLGRVLSALKDYGSNVTGIVTTTDNGGSTGRIRQQQGGIAWGDTRNCINQLVTEPTVSSKMFEYRFKERGELEGHNLGNLMLSALDDLSVRPLKAIEYITNLLSIDVNIIPMSEKTTNLAAITKSGQTVNGEINIDSNEEPLDKLYIDPLVPATQEAAQAIRHANIIIFGPGSFLTSVMPPLLLKEISKSIAQNKDAVLIFIQNLAPEHSPADSMPFEEKIAWCERACGGRNINIVLGNIPFKAASHTQFIQKQLASEEQCWRHDKEKLRETLNDIMNKRKCYRHAS
ncbi:gluconeogenesis factor YvcK family protein [Vibrio salinus]|uniref:gluconeogenesis factor YvcK family protein n=1 Tax=Vibrio salinus TaxID=2899784 RepID=UPI001E3D998D|nr:uridine diphosphate-N-acetylglucosamine-binding protein YvcK [Vibrio salinus]MCE0492959.1 uridine diphosphate-N-acetylglucosamine-binding protein YvcK [Vibrio salinus]